MKKIGFIGAYDKTDFMLYVAKLLSILGKSVILIDSSVNQKAKYIVPVIKPSKSYLTEYETIDVAVGFYKMQELEEYLGMQEGESLKYDYALIDIDMPETFNDFNMYDAQKNFFVTSFDLFSLKRGLEILSGVKDKIPMTKVLFSKHMLKEEDEYLDFLSIKCNIEWDKDKIFLPLEQGDQTVIIENQKSAKIKLKRLSPQYKEGLADLIIHAESEINYSDVKKAIKVAEKGV